MARPLSMGWLLGLALLCSSAPLRAQLPLPKEPAQGLGADALVGGRYVGSAQAPARALQLWGSLGYGYTEGVLDDRDRHQRLAGELAVGFVHSPLLQLSLRSELRYDRHTASERGDQGLLSSTALSSRHALQLSQRVAIAVQPTLWFPGAESAGRGLRALTPSIGGLATVQVTPTMALGFLLGYRLDRTRQALREPFALSASDRLAASVQDSDAALLGALFSYSARPLTTVLEWSWDLATQGPSGAFESPMRLRGAVQRVVRERLVPSAELVVDVSRRPDFDALVRIEPRVMARIGLGVLLGSLARPSSPPKEPPTVTARAPQLLPFKLRIVDDEGQPLTGARVVMAREAGREHISDEQGELTLALPRGATAVSIEKEGYEAQWQTLNPSVASSAEIALGPGLPAGELKGAVRNLAGEPLAAHIDVQPLGNSVQSSADGQFVISVAPGHYTLRITADGYEPQERQVTVELRGVTILVVDLRRARP